MRAPKLLIILVFLVVSTQACQTSSSPPPTTIQTAPTDLPVSLAEPSATATPEPVNHQATAEARDVLATANESARAGAVAARTQTAVVIQKTQAVAFAQAKSTKTAAVQATVVTWATAQAQPMYAEIQKLQEQNPALSLDGTYTFFPDFNQSWAQMNWAQIWSLQTPPISDFALRASTKWESASDKANWFNSGCGFVFGIEDDNNASIIFLGLDGYVNLLRDYYGKTTLLARDYYGRVSVPEGEAEVMLIVIDKRVRYYVNGEEVLNALDHKLSPGQIGLTLHSGTNKDFGTYCEINDIGLWTYK